jgi:hypothetical protein
MNCDDDYANKPEKYKLAYINTHREFFSTSKLQDEIKTEKFELNKFHASKKYHFY